jgi:hypothetical protein
MEKADQILTADYADITDAKFWVFPINGICAIRG